METSHRPIRPKRYAKPRAIGAYSSAGAMAKVDGRSKEALFMARIRRELTEHVGQPNAVQRQLIERCVRLTMQVEILDEQFLKLNYMSERDSRQYIAWSNALSRTLAKLGVNPAAKPNPSAGKSVKTEAHARKMVAGDLEIAKLKPKKSRFRKVKGVKIKTVVTTRPGFKSVIDHVIYPKASAPPSSPRSTEVGSFQTGVVDLAPERT